MGSDYFQNLNYTLGNEDTRLEFDVLPEGCAHVVAVCGCGGRVLPLVAKKPRRITAVDVSPAQLALLRLRIAVLSRRSTDDYLRFWGYPGRAPMTATERKAAFESLGLSGQDVTILTPHFEALGWGSLLMCGRWEKTFIKLSRIVRRVMGEAWIERFFAIEDPDAHRAFMRTSFPRARWTLVLALVANATVFNLLLYRGRFPKKNLPGSTLRFYVDAFDRLFAQGPARRNYFLQLCFFGELRYADGLPAEAQPDLLAATKRNLADVTWDFVEGDALDAVARAKEPVGFFSLSDVPSYFSAPIEQEFLARVRPGLAEGGLVLTRNYLRVPEELVTAGYREATSRYSDAIAREQFQMYDVHVYERGGPA